MTTFNGQLYTPSLAKAGEGAVLTTTTFGISCVSASEKIDIQKQDIVVRNGGTNQSMVFVSPRNNPNILFCTADRSILDSPLFCSDSNLKKQQRRFKRVSFKFALPSLIIASLIVAATLSLPAVWSGLVSVTASSIPLDWEESLAESTMADITAGESLMPQPQVDALLMPLVDPLVQAAEGSGYAFKFAIIDRQDINAFALPAGQIVLHSGLIESATTASEVQGVIAHEMAHVIYQHGLRNVISSAGVYIVITALLGDASGLVAVLGTAAPLLINQSYSRSFETEADSKGLTLLEIAQIDPQGMLTFFETLLAKHEHQGSVNSEWLSLLESHPATQDRIENIKELMSPQYYPSDQYESEFKALQSAVSTFSSHQ